MNPTEFRQAVESLLADVHTSMPGVIVSYDGMRAIVRPALDKLLANGQVLRGPEIVSVPVCWPVGDINGAVALISVPLKNGDPVLLHFAERALESWLSTGSGAPNDPRQFDITDAMATPMLRPGTVAADTENVSLQYGPGSIKLSPSGELTMKVTSWDLHSGKNTIHGPLIVKDKLTYENGMGGSGGENGTKVTGNIDHSEGVITSTETIQDGHYHVDSMNGDTSRPK